MELVHKRCCGLDVHKSSITACVIIAEPNRKRSKQARSFGAMMYGSSKLAHLQFHMNEGLAQRHIASLTGYELTWFYYGYSRTYACILGLTQIVGAALLLFRKTSLLGAITMLPVIIIILLIDLLILPPDYGPMVPALMICLSLLMLLRRDLPTLVQATFTTQAPEPIAHETSTWLPDSSLCPS